MVVAPTLRGGGAERVVSILTKEWAKFHQVTVVLFDASDTDYGCGGRIVDIQIPASKNFLRKIFNVGARSVRLMSIIQRECPDRVISFMESANLPAIAAAALTGYLDKLYVSVHCNPKTLSFPYQVLLPLLYRFSAGGIAVSEGVKRNLVSLGLPAGSFDVKHGPSEIIEDGDSGLLVPEGDVEALAAAIARVLDEVNLRRRLVAKGRERVQDYYVDKIAPRWLDGH